MTDNAVTGNTHWFLQYIQEHISDESRRKALEDKTLEAIANNQTHFLGSVKVLIGKSVSKDPYEAIREWEFYNEEITPSWIKRDKKHIIGSCNLCGSDLSRRIVAFRNIKNGEFMSTGTECKTHLNETFEFFDYTIRATEKRIKEKKDKKQKSLQDIANDPVKAINEAINNPKTDADKELTNMLKQLYDRLRPHFDLLESIQYTSPDAFSEKEFTPYFITPEKNGNFIGWFGQQGKNKLPDFIWDIYSRSKKDLTTISQSEWAALYMYSALHREESKKVFIGSIEDDLRLLESLDPEHEIIKKYGGINLDSIRDILEGDDVKITLLDVRKVFDAKPNILEIRKDINKEQASLYGGNVLEVLHTLKQIFLNEQGLWREEFKIGTAIYSKTLNKDDYLLVKNMLKRGKLGKGLMHENIYASYSMREFREVAGSLEIIRRKLNYQATVLTEKSIKIDYMYDVAPDKLARLDDQEFLRGSSYRLEEEFASEDAVKHARDAADNAASPNISLKEIIEKIENSDVSSVHKLFHRMKKEHIERIRKLHEHSLYHQDDIKRLIRMYKTVENYEICTDKIDDSRTLIKRVMAEVSYLIKEVKGVPDLAMVYFEPESIKVITAVSKGMQRLTGLIADAEKILKSNGLDISTKSMLDKMEELRREFVLYTGSTFSGGKNFTLYVGNVGLELCQERIGKHLVIYNPQKIEETYSKIRNNYMTLERAMKKHPEFIEQMGAIIENEDVFKRYYISWFTDSSSNVFYAKLRNHSKKDANKVLVSKTLIAKTLCTYETLSRMQMIETIFTGASDEISENMIKGSIHAGSADRYVHGNPDINYNASMVEEVTENTFPHKIFIKNILDMEFDRTRRWHSDNMTARKLVLYALEIQDYNSRNNCALKMHIQQA